LPGLPMASYATVLVGHSWFQILLHLFSHFEYIRLFLVAYS